MANGFTAAQTGQTRDRTRPMLQQRQKVLAKGGDPNPDMSQFLADICCDQPENPTFLSLMWLGKSNKFLLRYVKVERCVMS
jgi:hypothetical protein